MNRLRKAGALTLLGAATCAALTMPVAAAEPEPTPTPGPAATAEPAAPAPAEPVGEPGPAVPLGPEPVTPAPVAGDCSAVGLSDTISSVMAATSVYLKAHPDVNQALLDATKQPAFIAMGQMDGFFRDHPQEADQVRAIQQPARDYQARCGMVVEPAEAFMALQGV